jgi:hypothetical protein
LTESQPPKKPRKPRRKSQGARPAEPARPTDPKVWILLGIVLIAAAGLFYFVPDAENEQNNADTMRLFFDLVYSVLGRNLAFTLFGGLGALSIIGGIIGSIRKRSAAGAKAGDGHADESLP